MPLLRLHHRRGTGVREMRRHGHQLNGAGRSASKEDIAALFPAAKIARMDLDTTTRKGAHKAILDSFGSGESDILLGTNVERVWISRA